mmetsp:Transcript_6344/g.10064  ORF Transcript_6344/g.10064 Transcript_6344/m.10064 type:complete len:279 (-) Transcript_6344:34-870(-)
MIKTELNLDRNMCCSKIISRHYKEQNERECSSPPASHASTAYRGEEEHRCQPEKNWNCTAFSTVDRAKKGVTFKPTATVRTYSPGKGSILTKEEKSKLYYSRKELTLFNLEVNAICTLSQDLPHIRNSGTLLPVAEDSVIELEKDGDSNGGDAIDSLRGLELSMYPKRHQNKLLAQRSFLKYQRMLKSRPDISAKRKHLALAAASAKLNLWSSLVAIETARLDAIRAYDEDYSIPVVAPQLTVGISPFSFYRTRKQQRGSTWIHEASQQVKRRKIEQK